MDKSKFIPSMFHRRLLLLLGVCIVFIVLLGGQMFRLSVLEGAQRLSAAEQKLDSRTYLPTTRGNIYDRRDRMLALDRACYDIAVEYDVITGAWQREQAAKDAKKELGRTKWNAIGPEQREAAVKERLPKWKSQTNLLWGEICRLGEIAPDELQKRLDEIKAEVQSAAAYIWEQQRLKEQIDFGIAEEDFKARPIREQDEAHIILQRVSDEVAFKFKKLGAQMPDMIKVQDSRRREYPWLNVEVSLSRNSLPCPIRSDNPITIRLAGVADHILGGVRDEVWAEDLKRRPFLDPKTKKVIDLGGYYRNDIIGARGVEVAFEDSLRGTRGVIDERRDTGLQNRIEPVPGKDLHLTIDIALQARVQGILSPEFGLAKVQPWQNNTARRDDLGQSLNAAAVVIEVATGEIEAMVSMPTFTMGESMTPLQQQINQTLVNRAVEAAYPPGSIIKPLVLSAAVTESLHDLDSTITCKGHYFENNLTQARCWIFRENHSWATHGPLKAEEALARSCNMFFYTLADRLGIERLCKWYRRFGLGGQLNIGLLYQHTKKAKDGHEIQETIGESSGDVPTEQDIAAIRTKRELPFTQVIMGIGQGPVTWTPVQAANAYATIARGGVIRDATLLLDDPRGSRPQRTDDLHLNPRLVAATLEGLRESVMERFGTGYHITYDDHSDEPIINAVGVQVWAKTGTAQAPPLREFDTNNDGRITGKDAGRKDIDHAWFVGLVGPKDSNKPMHAIAVVVEYGGSGGRTAGPIANQIIRALQAEGYLPGDPNAAPFSKGHAPAAVEPEPEHEAEH